MLINKITSYNSIKTYVNNNHTTPYNSVRINGTCGDCFVKSRNFNNISFGSKINFEEVIKLTESISERPFSKSKVRMLYEKYQNSQGITSADDLPQEWKKRIANVINFDTQKFFETLGEIFTADRHFADIDRLSTSLDKLFKETGITKPEEKVSAKYIGKGFFGRTFKIDINDEGNVLIKEFKRTYRHHNNHGNLSEQNIAEHIKRFSGDQTNMVKYYFGDAKNGIMVTDFITPETIPPKNRINLDDLGLAYDDNKPRNFINGYIIDYGGIITINNLAGNKTAQKIHQNIKYITDNEERLKLCNKIFNNINDNSYKDNLIGLAHSIKYLDKDCRQDWYKKLYELNDNNVNISLIENINDISDKNIIEGLAANPDMKVKETLAREIRKFPQATGHKLFETLCKEENNSIKKYLARNINFYYKNISNRINIFNSLTENSDRYADIALINSLKYINKESYDKYFEHFYNKNDVVVQSVLAGNIEVFGEDTAKIKYWLEKLMKIDNPIVKRELCETIKFLPENLAKETFEKLVGIKDMNAKEILAESMTSIPRFYTHIDWLEMLLDGADNSVKRELASQIHKIPDLTTRNKWIEKILQNTDSSVKKLICD